ncbi:hypothetical protein SKPI104516_02155 [Skermania piniformis]
MFQAIEVSSHGVGIDELSDWASRFGRKVEKVKRLPFSTPDDRNRAIGGHILAQAAQEFMGVWMGVGGRVEESKCERQDVGERGLVNLGDRVEAVARHPRQPGMRPRLLVKPGDAVRLRGNSGCDL